MLSGISPLPALARMSWVLLTVLWLILQTQARTVKQSPEFKLHELVHPKKLHMAYQRELESSRKERNGKQGRCVPNVHYQITLSGEEIILHLQNPKFLLGSDGTETKFSSRAENVTSSPQKRRHCHYEGHILNEKNSAASISTGDGLRGDFTYHGQRHVIKPLESTDQGEHAVFAYDRKELDTVCVNPTCGVNGMGRKQRHSRLSRSLGGLEQEEFLQAQKYISLFLVLDNAFYKTYNGNLTQMKTFVFNVLNLLNVIYNTIDVHVALVGMEIWSDGDKIKVEPRIGTTFSNFMRWHRSHRSHKRIHSHAQLLSGIGFRNGRVGMVASNSLCSPSSVAVIEAKKNNVSLAAVMSHELGHALGMPDIPYFTKCPSGSCAMNQYLSSKFPKDFSTSCREHFRRYLLAQKPKCLLQAPSPKSMITPPVCGNHFLEVGEGCDCGPPKVCSDSCCDPLTCRRKLGPGCGESPPQLTV
ncbi:ADAM DEC1 [Perognathus longimembris pacificus]|uniref:ADAM DEC1 n=1 Tax=Perognathus longimembris pacificus TaxID=214514 RepID=UPI002019B1EE|nr:ADAM DEC1 [Perognathus longimembris pacificus]